MITLRKHQQVGTILVLLFLMLVGCASAGRTAGPRSAPDDGPLREQWGIEVLSLRLTAGNSMIDFRYRVLDPAKAAPLFDRKLAPQLIDAATGATFLVPDSPKLGSLRTTRPPQQDRNYFMLFANPGHVLAKGSRVTVVIGDLRIENLEVE